MENVNNIVGEIVEGFQTSELLTKAEVVEVATLIYKVCDQKGFLVSFNEIWQLLKLQSSFKLAKQKFRAKFKKNVDYVEFEELQANGRTRINYKLTAKCFQRFCMQTNTPICNHVQELYMLVLEAVKKLQQKLQAGEIRFYEGTVTDAEVEERKRKRVKTAKASKKLMDLKLYKKDKCKRIKLSGSGAGPMIHNILNEAWVGCTRKLLAVRLNDESVNVSDHDTHIAAAYKEADKKLMEGILSKRLEDGEEPTHSEAIELSKQITRLSREKQALVKEYGGLHRDKQLLRKRSRCSPN